jgi:hypothetical protein
MRTISDVESHERRRRVPQGIRQSGPQRLPVQPVGLVDAPAQEAGGTVHQDIVLPFFERLWVEFGPDLQILAAVVRGQVVGAALLLKSGETLSFSLVGLPETLETSHDVYFTSSTPSSTRQSGRAADGSTSNRRRTGEAADRRRAGGRVALLPGGTPASARPSPRSRRILFPGFASGPPGFQLIVKDQNVVITGGSSGQGLRGLYAMARAG